MLDEKINIIGTPYSVVLGWGYGTREARREPGFLEEYMDCGKFRVPKI
jgi:hypothetical protein